MNEHMADRMTEETEEQAAWGMHLVEMKQWADSWEKHAKGLRECHPEDTTGANTIEMVITNFRKHILKPLK